MSSHFVPTTPYDKHLYEMYTMASSTLYVSQSLYLSQQLARRRQEAEDAEDLAVVKRMVHNAYPSELKVRELAAGLFDPGLPMRGHTTINLQGEEEEEEGEEEEGEEGILLHESVLIRLHQFLYSPSALPIRPWLAVTEPVGQTDLDRWAADRYRHYECLGQGRVATLRSRVRELVRFVCTIRLLSFAKSCSNDRKAQVQEGSTAQRLGHPQRMVALAAVFASEFLRLRPFVSATPFGGREPMDAHRAIAGLMVLAILRPCFPTVPVYSDLQEVLDAAQADARDGHSPTKTAAALRDVYNLAMRQYRWAKL